MLSAMDHPGLKIIGHPTGKMAGKRKEMNLDFDSIVHHASQSNCHFELNCQPRRMDLNEEKCRLVIEHDAGLVISTDAHRPDEFGFMDYGVKYARRAAVKATDVLNTKSLKMLMKSVHG